MVKKSHTKFMICDGVGGTNKSIFILGFCFSFIMLCGAVH